MTTDRQEADELSDLAEMMRHEQEFPRHSASIDPAVRRARRRRGWAIAAIVLTLVLTAAGGYVGWALTAPVPDPAATSAAPRVPAPAPAVIALPAAGAAAVSVAGAEEYLGPDADGIWLASGSAAAVPIASISKLVTALVVLDAHPLQADDPGPTLRFGAADHDLYDEYYLRGATIAAMPEGSSMSLRDALATMLIPSASNYAEAVSTWAFGSQWAFLRATREWLDAHGLTDTTIVEPTGIDLRNTSTPSDLIALGRLAAADPVIAGIAATSSITIPGPGLIVTTNGLLGADGVTGLKTGNLGPGTHALLFTATLDVGADARLSVTGVRLGGATRETVARDVQTLLASIRAGFHEVPLARAGQQVGSISTVWGDSARLVLAGAASIFTWSDTPIAVTMDVGTPTAYVDGEVVGEVTWTAGPHTVSADVVVEGDIGPPTEVWRLTHPSELGGP